MKISNSTSEDNLPFKTSKLKKLKTQNRDELTWKKFNNFESTVSVLQFVLWCLRLKLRRQKKRFFSEEKKVKKQLA